MRKLLITVTLKDQVLQQHGFEKEVVKIGRHRACDVVLDNPAVSRVHAELCWDEATLWLQDAGSSNGLDLNGRNVRREALADGDVITIGKFTLHIRVPVQREDTTRSGTLSGRDLTIRVASDQPRKR